MAEVEMEEPNSVRYELVDIKVIKRKKDKKDKTDKKDKKDKKLKKDSRKNRSERAGAVTATEQSATSSVALKEEEGLASHTPMPKVTGAEAKAMLGYGAPPPTIIDTPPVPRIPILPNISIPRPPVASLEAQSQAQYAAAACAAATEALSAASVAVAAAKSAAAHVRQGMVTTATVLHLPPPGFLAAVKPSGGAPPAILSPRLRLPPPGFLAAVKPPPVAPHAVPPASPPQVAEEEKGQRDTDAAPQSERDHGEDYYEIDGFYWRQVAEKDGQSHTDAASYNKRLHGETYVEPKEVSARHVKPRTPSCTPLEPDGTRFTGRVKALYAAGHGFVECQATHDLYMVDMFCDIVSIRALPDLRVGEEVTFEVELHRYRPRVKNMVRRVEEQQQCAEKKNSPVKQVEPRAAEQPLPRAPEPAPEPPHSTLVAVADPAAVLATLVPPPRTLEEWNEAQDIVWQGHAELPGPKCWIRCWSISKAKEYYVNVITFKSTFDIEEVA